MKKCTTLVLLMCVTASTSHGLTLPDGLVPPMAITTGLGVGYVAQDIAREGGYKSVGRSVVGTVAGLAASLLAGKWLSRYTAKGKYNRAKRIAEGVAADTLISINFPTAELTRAHVRKSYFGSNWPFVEAHEHLVATMHDLAHAQRLARNAKDYAGSKVSFRRDCEKLLMVLAASIELVGKRTDEVVGDGEEYDRQYRRYQEWRKIQVHEQSLQLQNYALIQGQFNHWDEMYKNDRQHQEFLDLVRLLK